MPQCHGLCLCVCVCLRGRGAKEAWLQKGGWAAQRCFGVFYLVVVNYLIRCWNLINIFLSFTFSLFSNCLRVFVSCLLFRICVCVCLGVSVCSLSLSYLFLPGHCPLFLAVTGFSCGQNRTQKLTSCYVYTFGPLHLCA